MKKLIATDLTTDNLWEHRIENWLFNEQRTTNNEQRTTNNRLFKLRTKN